MKKYLLWMLTAFLCLFAGGTLSAQSSLTVADGTETNDYVPVYGFYADAYLRSQTIYPASMLTDLNGLSITSMSFYFNSAPSSNWGCVFNVTLMEVTDASFTSEAFLPTTGGTTVYTGELNNNGDILTINFDIPYNYNGGNLLVEVSSVTVGNYYSADFIGIYSASSSVRAYDYSQVPDTYDAEEEDFIPKTTFGYGVPALCNKPYYVHTSNITATDVTICWSGSGNTSAYTAQYMFSNQTSWDNDAVEQTMTDTSITLSNLQPGASYKFRVNATCTDNTPTDWTYFNFNMLNEPVTLPYFEDFETNPESITNYMCSHTGDNGWFIGSATGVPDPNSSTAHSLYISSNSGISNTYNQSSTSYAYATLDVVFDNTPMEWHLSFDYLCNGEGSYWDYLSVYIMDATQSVPVDEIPNGTALLDQITGVTSWTHFDMILDNVTGTSKKIIFFWKNDNSAGNDPPAAIDNIGINGFSCAQPTQFSATSISNDNVTLDWTEAGSATSWNISYGPQGYAFGDDDETIVTTTTHPYSIGNLTTATPYDFYVQSDCGSSWAGPITLIPGSFSMQVNGSDTITTCALVIFDNGGSNGDYLPNSDSYLVLYPSEPNVMMMVSGTLSTENCCDHLYIYDGVGTNGTLLGQFQGISQTVNAISTTGPLTLYFHSDGSINNSGYQLLAECVSCFPPSNLTVENSTLDGATISWSGVADSYVVYLNGPTSNMFTTTDTVITFSGLSTSSTYSVQVSSLCDGDTSMLSSAISFATGCDAITITADNPWAENFENYTGGNTQDLVCWDVLASTTLSDGTFPTISYNNASACHSGTSSVEFKGNPNDVNMVLLPAFTNPLQDLRLSFWATATAPYFGVMEVGVITDPTDTSTFELVGTCGLPGSRGGSYEAVGHFGNYMGPFDFSGVTATSGRIALRFTSDGYYLSWNLDDFVVGLMPECMSPVKTSVTANVLDGHNATITWVDNDPTHNSWTVYYKPSNSNTWSTVTSNDTTITLTNLNPVTSYDVYVITNCGTPEANPDATLTCQFTTDVACPAPFDLSLASVSSDAATVSWEGNAASYNVEYGETGFTPGAGTSVIVSTNSINLTNLTPNTTYTVLINSDCNDANDSLSTTVSFSFTTTMIPTELPYQSDLSDPTDIWAFNNGTCSNYWLRGTTNNTSALFVTNNGSTPGYNTSSSSIVSVEKLFTVGDDESFIVSFDVQSGGESYWDYLKVFFAPAENAYPADTYVPDFATNSYSTYAINFENYLSYTEYTNYPYKFNLTQGNTIHIEVEMPNPYENPTTASAAKLVFVWRNDNSSGTQPGPIISNISVAMNVCRMPSELSTSNVTASSVDINWLPGDEETEWELEYGLTGFTHGNGTLASVYATPTHTLNNLTAGTFYDVYVRAICDVDEASSWAGPLTISPGTFIMPANANTSITSCDIIIYDDGGYANNYSVNNDSYLTIYPLDSNSLVTIQGTLTTESCCDYLEIYDGADTSGTLFGQYKGPGVTIPLLTSTTGPVTLYFHSDVSLVYSGFELTVSCISSSCPSPTNFTVSNIDLNSADLSWTAGGNETSWVVEYKESSATTWTAVSVSTTSYQLTGLNALTYYDVRVKADCGAGDESAYQEASFITPMCNASNACQYTFTLVDDYGDGWNNGYLTVEQSGVIIATLEATDNDDEPSTENVTLNLCDNTNIDLVWHTGQYDEEVGITLFGPDGTQLFTIFDLEDIPSDTLYSFTTNCNGSGPGPVIVDPTVATTAATNVAQTTATLNGTITNPDNVTITTKGFEWKATTGGTYQPVTVTGSNLTYNLTGLTASTSYTYKAFITFDGNTIYGEEVTFTTLDEVVEPCETPTGLEQIISLKEAGGINVIWIDNAGVSEWNLQYRPLNGEWITVVVTGTPSYSITGLVNGEMYELRVQAVCGDGVVSEWSSILTATATNSGIDDYLLNSINLYPNPAKEVVNVQCTMNDVQIESIEVFDVYGKLLQTVSMTPETTTINVSGLAAGMYFVRVTTEQGVATKSFVKK